MAKLKTNQEGGAVVAKDPGAAGKQLESNQRSEGAAKGMAHKKGGAKYGHKGAAKAKPDANGNGVPDYAEDGVGAARMGYSQSFGAARKGGYAKGAAKVANIMSFGAAKYGHKGAADGGHDGAKGHEHSLFDTGRIKRGITSAANTAMKVGRTVTRGLGDIGAQAIDILHPDHGDDDMKRRPPGATQYGDKVNQKYNEMDHFQKSRDLTREGKTYFNLSSAFDDDGEGGIPTETLPKKYN
jgi:hypothetical protein